MFPGSVFPKSVFAGSVFPPAAGGTPPPPTPTGGAGPGPVGGGGPGKKKRAGTFGGRYRGQEPGGQIDFDDDTIDDRIRRQNQRVILAAAKAFMKRIH